MTVENSEFTKYNKRIEDLLEDAEIEAELEAEKKIRSKHTRLITFSAIGLTTLFALYLGIKSKSSQVYIEGEIKEASQKIPYTPNPKPIPFPTKLKQDRISISNFKSKTTETVRNESSFVKYPPIKKVSIPSNHFQNSNLEKSTIINISNTKNSAIKTKNSIPKDLFKKTKSANYFIQIGAFSVKENADSLTNKLNNSGLSAIVKSKLGNKKIFTVFVGFFKDKISAKGMADDLKRQGYFPKLEIYEKNRFSFNVGKFLNSLKAKDFKNKLDKRGFITAVKESEEKAGTHIVGIGKYHSRIEAIKALGKIQALGLKGFVRKNG